MWRDNKATTLLSIDVFICSCESRRKCKVVTLRSDDQINKTFGVVKPSPRGLEISLFTTASRTALRPSQPPTQWVPGALSLGVKRLGRGADHSPPSSAEVKEWVELYLHSPNTP
jgi:hypothetical protein